MNEAVDKVRRMEQKFEPDLKSTRFLWLYNQDNLKQEQLEKLETLKNTNLKTAKAYQLKLTLQEIYENATDRIEAMIILKKWYNWAVRCRLEPIVAFAKKPGCHLVALSLKMVLCKSENFEKALFQGASITKLCYSNVHKCTQSQCMEEKEPEVKTTHTLTKNALRLLLCALTILMLVVFFTQHDTHEIVYWFIFFILVVLILIVYQHTIFRPRSELLRKGEEIAKNLEALSQVLIRVSTGDLATSMTMQKTPLGKIPEGDLYEIAELFVRLETSISESVNSFGTLTDPPCRRLCYVGSDSFAEGKMNGEIIGTLTGGKGSIAILVSSLSSVNHVLRRKGVLNTLAERYPQVKEVETAETNEDPEQTYAMTVDILRRHPDVKIIYVSEGSTPQFAAQAIVDQKRQDTTKVVTHDLTPEIKTYIEKGVIAATLSQDPFAQGYDPIVHIYNHIVCGWEPVAPRLLTKLQSIDTKNLYLFSTKRDTSNRPKIMGDVNTSKRIKIAMLCISETGFWAPVIEGAKAASADLARYSVQVDIIIPEAGKDGILSANTFIPIIRDLADKKYDGISLPIFDRALIPVINEVVDAGVTIATYNSEPISLREMIALISAHAGKLIDMSQELATSAIESEQANKQINMTFGKISDTLQNQLREFKEVVARVDELAATIVEVNRAAASGATSAKAMTEKSYNDLLSIDEMRKNVSLLQRSAELTKSSIQALMESVDQIGSIVTAIGDIANQTNVLAINASIEAARAGERGKGFSVLAGEIRKLAEQSTRSTTEIDNLIGHIKNNMDVAFAETLHVSEEAQKNSEVAQLSENILTEINTLSQENLQNMNIIFTAVKEMQEFSAKITSSMRMLAESNSNSTAAVQEIVTSTAEMTTQAMEVAKTATRLLEMAQGQKILLSPFRLDGK